MEPGEEKKAFTWAGDNHDANLLISSVFSLAILVRRVQMFIRRFCCFVTCRFNLIFAKKKKKLSFQSPIFEPMHLLTSATGGRVDYCSCNYRHGQQRETVSLIQRPDLPPVFKIPTVPERFFKSSRSPSFEL